jgi:DNA modification methylase
MERQSTAGTTQDLTVLNSSEELDQPSAHNDKLLNALFEAKNSTNTISFKKELYYLNEKNRASHNMHKYPAKLIHHIPYLFIRNNITTSVGDTVLDVFCGSGTVLVEAMLASRNCIGVDVNPLCCLISKVKTTPLDQKNLLNAEKTLFQKLKQKGEIISPRFPNIDFWFTKGAKQSLSRIKWAIDSCNFDRDYKDFFYVCLSSIIRKSSNADPRISPPVFSKSMRKKVLEGRRVYPIKYFKQEVMNNIERNASFSSSCSGNCKSLILFNDAKKLGLGDEEVDLVITSPPYMSAQKYFRSTRLELFWLVLLTEEEFQKLDSKLVGTERIKSTEYSRFQSVGLPEADNILEKIYKIDKFRASIASRYFIDLKQVLAEIYRCLKYNKYFVLIIGDNEVKGFKVPSHYIVTKMAEEIGFEKRLGLVDEIKSRGLMTKRNKTAGMINSEWILAFQKV